MDFSKGWYFNWFWHHGGLESVSGMHAGVSVCRRIWRTYLILSPRPTRNSSPSEVCSYCMPGISDLFCSIADFGMNAQQVNVLTINEPTVFSFSAIWCSACSRYYKHRQWRRHVSPSWRSTAPTFRQSALNPKLFSFNSVTLLVKFLF